MKGRKPKPRRLHELNGDPSKRHLSREDEPRPDVLDKVPKPEAHLNPRARAVHFRIMPELVRMRLISKIDRASLAAYCSAVATYEEADERLKTEPWTTTTARGGSRPNPLFKIRDDAMKQIAKFASEFGLTPSTRSRVKGAQSPQQDAFGGFLDEGRAARRRDDEDRPASSREEQSRPPSDENKWN